MCAVLMLRRFLACLALLTGLAAAGAPAQAQVVSALASRMEASATGGVLAQRSSVSMVAPRPSEPKTVVDQVVAPLLKRAPLQPTVLTRIDRARE